MERYSRRVRLYLLEKSGRYDCPEAEKGVSGGLPDKRVMVIQTPPMGWNSWNTFGAHIDEALIRETADAMVREGLDRLGYSYLIIDDCWASKERNGRGELMADGVKFPNGIKAVADYVHSKGLKFGLHSCCGAMTCAGYPGSYQHEFTDAATFAAWGVDCLKYDFCYRDPNVPPEILYRRMGLALANCGRDILFSACNWGRQNTAEWIRTTGADTWRSTADIFDSWGSIKKLAQAQLSLLSAGGRGCFNDMDMLVVGMNGVGNEEYRQQGCSDAEYRTHFSLWSLLQSPLILGCDVRHLTAETKAIIGNRELIALNRDPAARQVFVRCRHPETEAFIASRLLENGDLAVGFFNLGDAVSRASESLLAEELGWTPEARRRIHARDLWTGEEWDVENGVLVGGGLEPHACRMMRLSLR